ncbi:MAG: LytTR family DNA-binding domain-containing protein [bacterium]|nr:LytTR family DNA-binding domain-containing protein [bacterium]
MNTYNVTIIDDSPIDVLAFKKIISGYCININLVVHISSIDEAIIEFNKNKPDIVFLDVMFKNSIIFDFLDEFCLEEVPIVFVSSEKEYAVNAFENNAVDFILKPFKVENLILGINKAIKKIEMNNFQMQNDFSLKNRNTDFDYLAIASLDKIDIIKKEDVMFCMAEGKYTTFFLFGGKKIVSSKNLGEYEKLLDNSCFYRIHHGYIINIRYLISVIKKDGVYCELANKITIPVSKRRQESFNKFIKLKN